MNNTEDPKKTVADAASAAKDSVKDAANTTREAVQDAASTAKDSAKDFAHEAQQSAKEAFETTREAASHAYDKAKEGLRDVEKELSPAIDNLTARAQEFCSKGIDFCAESSEKARRQFQHATECTTRYVVEQPGKSILMAAAAGAVIATAFLMGRRR